MSRGRRRVESGYEMSGRTVDKDVSQAARRGQSRVRVE